MPAAKDEWIGKQLELCEAATKGPWLAFHGSGTGYGHLRIKTANQQMSWMQREADCRFIIAARKGYPATLEALQTAQGELRIVYAILQGLHVAIDAMSHENIKEVVGQLLIAGADWLEKEQADDSEA